jgi:uncharacterized protein YaaQ
MAKSSFVGNALTAFSVCSILITDNFVVNHILLRLVLLDWWAIAHRTRGGQKTQLLLAIVQAEDADLLVDRFVAQEDRVTRINSVGSFLMRGNATILIGVENGRVEPVMSTIRTDGRTRREFMNAASPVESIAGSLPAAMPVEVRVGGAIVFQFPVKRFLRLQGGSAPPVADQNSTRPFPQPWTNSAGVKEDKCIWFWPLCSTRMPRR